MDSADDGRSHGYRLRDPLDFKSEQRSITTVVADAALFASPLALLLTIYFPSLLPAVGSLTPYLVFGGFRGLLAGLKALFPEMRRRRRNR